MINGGNFNNLKVKKRVLVAPLNWGLGHATRCIPLINELAANGCVVLIAATGPVKILLQQEFPNLLFLEPPAYNIRYSRKKFWLPFKLLVQIPAVLHTIRQENKWLQNIIAGYKLDGVIADNRFGMYNKTVPCVYITHQLAIMAKSRIGKWLAQKIHYHYINKFSECWVPDAAATPNLAGELSHPAVNPAVAIQYLGPLSRFKQQQADKIYDLLIVLSGPEPQRSMFENILLKQLETYKGKAMLVRGLPGNLAKIPGINNVSIVNHLASHELSVAMQQAVLVLCRSGYTTIMDLIQLRQKAILVPTPGQSEQEYLATYLQQQGLFACMQQHQFSLQKALQQQQNFSSPVFETGTTIYKKIIANWLQTPAAYEDYNMEL